MFGQFLSNAVKVVTSPLDAAESVMDVMCGGDGSKQSKRQSDNFLSEIRDGICNGLEDIDE
jgi:hypothetical protein